MKARFADTSFYVALLNEADAGHEKALETGGSWRGPIVTTEYVLGELGNCLAAWGAREAFVSFMRQMETDGQTRIVWATEQLFRDGLELYAKYWDKEWSMTDCISFVLMQREGLVEALTADHHFDQAGFVALMR